MLDKLYNKVKVRLKEGNMINLEAWQTAYGLPIGSAKIGKYFSLNEPRFRQDIEQFGELIVDEQLMRLLDGIREARGKATRLNSFNRNEKYQLELKERGFKAATFSPHVVKMGADIDTDDAEETRVLAMLVRQVGKKLGIECRIGWKTYVDRGSSFVHVDVCPEYYGYQKPFNHHDHPNVWELENEW